jgi:hypothetical protein
MPRNNSGRGVTARIRVLISTLMRHATRVFGVAPGLWWGG